MIRRPAGINYQGRRLVAIPTRRARRGVPAVSRAGPGQRPSLARRVSVARLRSPSIDAIARNRSILG